MSTPIKVVRRVSLPPTPQPTPCRIWQGGVSKRGGYGIYHRMVLHRWVMETALGRKLGPGEIVMHLCDNPPCFRFDHLRVGTKGDNNRDRSQKGRSNRLTISPPPHPQGADHPRAILNDDDVRSIRASLVLGESQASIGRRFGVTRFTINDIARGKSWGHLKEQP